MSRDETSPRRRTRRTSEESRGHILDAAERVFARLTPDEAGLKEVADEAGVTHGLVTHHFGTWRAVVDATLERRLEAMRSRALAQLVVGAMQPEPSTALSAALADLVGDRVTVRLLLWTLLRERDSPAELAFVRGRGLKLIADALEARAGDGVERADVEFTVMAAIALIIGFAAAGDVMAASLGRDAPPPAAELGARIERMLRAQVKG